MSASREFRELLVADLALMQGVASAAHVAAALREFWERRERLDVLLADELARIAGIDRKELRPVEADADALVAQVGGDARIALSRRGAGDRSVPGALDRGRTGLPRASSVLGVPTRAPLRPLSEDRYVDFQVAGRGGMGVVYAALDAEMNRLVAFKMVRTDLGVPGEEGPSATPLGAVRPQTDSPLGEAFEELEARLVQEAWVTGGLEHPGIVPVYEIGQTPTGIPYYTMRFVRGDRSLAQAIAEKRDAPIEERLALLEPFLKVCDALHYAHDRGVVHRDLKPANVALGSYGEVVLLDWGLARLEGREDVASSAWKEKVQELRSSSGFHTMEGGAMGTAGYMSPEAALGQLAEVDARSDVYSLGAILYEILTGRLPYEFRTFAEYASLVVETDPPTASAVEPSVPEALSALCAAALSRERQRRPPSAEALAAAVRSSQALDAVDREVDGLLRDARAAVASATDLQGEARLKQVNRALVALEQVEAKRPGRTDAADLRRRAEGLREEGIRQRERATARRMLVRAAIAGTLVLAVAGFVVAGVLEERAQDAEEARGQAEAARIEAERQRDEVLRLADAKKVRDLVTETERLWPVHPERAPAMAAWLVRAKDAVSNRALHEESLTRVKTQAEPYAEEDRTRDRAEDDRRLAEARDRLRWLRERRREIASSDERNKSEALESIREDMGAVQEEIGALESSSRERRTWRFADEALAWRHQVLTDLLAGLAALEDPRDASKGLIRKVDVRHRQAITLRQRSVDDHEKDWREVTRAISASAAYGGIEVVPQVGLVPLGKDPRSGLFEFAHLGSGAVPAREPESGNLVRTDDFAIVLVLVPGGTFRMGAQRIDASAPSYDREAEPDEAPVHDVTLSPYFLSKYEMTQAQWTALTGGESPSGYKPGTAFARRAITPRNPVEQVSWDDATAWLGRWSLTLPTEAQWEGAARAGTDTPWSFGSKVGDLGQHGNVADAYLRNNGGWADRAHSVEVDDGHGLHAPVGSYLPNAFGLHDVHGNVYEWCRDLYEAYGQGPAKDPLRDGPGTRVLRGGSWSDAARNARSAFRSRYAPGFRYFDLGIRPARPLAAE